MMASPVPPKNWAGHHWRTGFWQSSQRDVPLACASGGWLPARPATFTLSSSAQNLCRGVGGSGSRPHSPTRRSSTALTTTRGWLGPCECKEGEAAHSGITNRVSPEPACRQGPPLKLPGASRSRLAGRRKILMIMLI